MRAEVGDEVVLAGPGSPPEGRIGTIAAIQGRNGGPPYLVRWLADYETEIDPGATSHIEVRHRPRHGAAPAISRRGTGGAVNSPADPVDRWETSQEGG
jgi:Domain of unknown function (DUF1918)